MTASVRLADLLAGLSLVSDLGFGLPPEEAMRRSVIATSLARRLDLDERQVSDVYYTALLQHIGCTGFAHETAVAYGDEIVFNAAVARMEQSGIGGLLGLIAATTSGRPPSTRLRTALTMIAHGSRFGRQFATATCEVGRETARRLGLGEGVRRGLLDVVESWDGKEGARGLRGEEISIAARVTAVASVATTFHGIGGDEAVGRLLRGQAGGPLDPAIVATFVEHERQILGETDGRDPRDAVLDAEPMPVRLVATSQLVDVAAAIGDVADLKSRFTLGHSSGVAALAVAAGGRVGLEPASLTRLELAGLLHDVGRVGVSNAIWERPGPLTHAGWEQVRLHAYHSERILSRSEALRSLALVCGMHHERLDGSGYHRASRGRDMPRETHILAAADAYDAMTHDRPYRSAMAPDAAAARLAEDARSGRLDPESVNAVLAAAGIERRHGGRVRVARAAGLSDREVDVLRLMAQGLSNGEIADRLTVSRRTAEHHVQHIYTKIGVSSRAAAALFAMEHSLLD